ncbi:hypothetical protein BDZ90DRAFT_234356 [Jaminaea rosea]|uniref:Mis18 domain-containing protein n=1 Tax=Jaminaea rosea TaxID=1569628 RepID=A0A316UK21_9BASI|nr:hypothetical protein BDZ90DRAFT_234356 [Jaminaea rosea]PWN25148.1 hypothetical protein BDZ90DRAFT_234356 [Jaminaea rosea]
MDSTSSRYPRGDFDTPPWSPTGPASSSSLVILQCASCRHVLADSSTLVTIRKDLRLIVTTTATAAVVCGEDEAGAESSSSAANDGEGEARLLLCRDASRSDLGSTYTTFSCGPCGEKDIGRIYKSTGPDLDEMRDGWSFDLEKVIVYPLGSAKRLVPGARDTRRATAAGDGGSSSEGAHGAQGRLRGIREDSTSSSGSPAGMSAGLPLRIGSSSHHGGGSGGGMHLHHQQGFPTLTAPHPNHPNHPHHPLPQPHGMGRPMRTPSVAPGSGPPGGGRGSATPGPSEWRRIQVLMMTLGERLMSVENILQQQQQGSDPGRSGSGPGPAGASGPAPGGANAGKRRADEAGLSNRAMPTPQGKRPAGGSTVGQGGVTPRAGNSATAGPSSAVAGSTSAANGSGAALSHTPTSSPLQGRQVPASPSQRGAATPSGPSQKRPRPGGPPTPGGGPAAANQTQSQGGAAPTAGGSTTPRGGHPSSTVASGPAASSSGMAATSVTRAPPPGSAKKPRTAGPPPTPGQQQRRRGAVNQPQAGDTQPNNAAGGEEDEADELDLVNSQRNRATSFDGLDGDEDDDDDGEPDPLAGEMQVGAGVAGATAAAAAAAS